MKKRSLSSNTLKQFFVMYRYFLPGAIAIAVLVLGMVFTVSSVGAIYQSLTIISDTQESMDEVNQRLARLDELSRGELQTMKSVIDQALPAQKPVFETLTAVRAISQEVGVVITDLSSRPGNLASESANLRQVVSAQGRQNRATQRNTPLYEKINVTLEVEGTFNQLNEFFKRLVTITPLMDLDTVRVSSRGIAASDPNTKFSSEVDLAVYWMAASTTSKTDLADLVELSGDEQQIYQTIDGYDAFDSQFLSPTATLEADLN